MVLFMISSMVLSTFLMLPLHPLLRFIQAYIGAVYIYVCIFGAVQSFSYRCRYRPWTVSFYIIGTLLTVPFKIRIHIFAVALGLLGRKHHLFVCQKKTNIPLSPFERYGIHLLLTPNALMIVYIMYESWRVLYTFQHVTFHRINYTMTTSPGFTAINQTFSE